MRNWIGKVQAEGVNAEEMWMVTLTYADSDADDSVILNYRPVQRFWKRLRKEGYQFRFFIVGEYGGQKMRSHWHAIIFWEGKPPAAEFSTKRYNWPHWPEGFSFIEKVRNLTYAGAYVAKYLLKDDKAVVRASTNPSLGEKYLMQYARNRALDGKPLFGEHVTYTTGAYAKTGELFQYHLDKACRLPAKMAQEYLRYWAKIRPNQPLQYHPSTQEYFDEIGLDMDYSEPQNRHLAEYFERHYPVEISPIRHHVETYDNGFQVIYVRGYLTVEKRDSKGKIAWAAVHHRENTKDVSPAPIDRLQAKRIIERSPRRLLRVS